MQWILPRTSLCLSSLPWVRGCVWFCCLKSKECGLLVTTCFLFFPASAMEQLVLAMPATLAGASSMAPLLWAAKEKGASGTSILRETFITPAWLGEVKGTPGVMYSKWWHWPRSTSHSPGKLWGTGLVGVEEWSHIHSPRQKSPWKDLKNGIIEQFGISGH